MANKPAGTVYGIKINIMHSACVGNVQCHSGGLDAENLKFN